MLGEKATKKIVLVPLSNIMSRRSSDLTNKDVENKLLKRIKCEVEQQNNSILFFDSI